MPTRRRLLAAVGGLAAGIAGCLGERSGSAGGSPTGTATEDATATPAPARTPTLTGTAGHETDGEGPAPRRGPEPSPPETVTSVEGDLPDWEPDRWIETSYEHVLGLDLGQDRVYATFSDEGGGSAVAALDPGATEFAWTTSVEGEAEHGGYRDPHFPTDAWGVLVVGNAVYSVHGRSESYEWTRLHALDAASGDSRWSFEAERRLTVRGVLDDVVVASGREFFEPESTHDTPEEPLATTVYGLDAATGERRWAATETGVGTVAVGSEGAYVAHGTRLTALRPSGSRRWTRQADAEIRELTVVDGTVVVAEGSDVDTSSLAGYGADGERAWTAPVSARYLVPHGDRVYAMDDRVAAVTADGEVAWAVDARGNDPLLASEHDRLYARTAVQMNSVDAYDLSGGDRPYRFETPSDDGWPLAATADTLVAEAITPDQADFTSLFAVDAETGGPQAVYRPRDTVFTAEGYDGALYVGFGGGRLGVFSSP